MFTPRLNLGEAAVSHYPPHCSAGQTLGHCRGCPGSRWPRADLLGPLEGEGLVPPRGSPPAPQGCLRLGPLRALWWGQWFPQVPPEGRRGEEGGRDGGGETEVGWAGGERKEGGTEGERGTEVGKEGERGTEVEREGEREGRRGREGQREGGEERRREGGGERDSGREGRREGGKEGEGQR